MDDLIGFICKENNVPYSSYTGRKNIEIKSLFGTSFKVNVVGTKELLDDDHGMIIFLTKELNDDMAIDKALEKYRTFATWNQHGSGWTNRMKNTISLYRHGDYSKTY